VQPEVEHPLRRMFAVAGELKQLASGPAGARAAAEVEFSARVLLKPLVE
jgi:hypothetical protein